MDTDTMIRRFGPVPYERAIHILRQVCHSLSEADSRGLIHRDVKPANVFLCRYGEEYDFVKVLDFGLVKAFGASADQEPGLTRGDVFQGTPAFIAPEQALGLPDLDGRVDLYATGCVGYWLLTGQLVFDAPSPMAMAMEHVSSVPRPPSTRVDHAIPEDLDRLLLACLAKDPRDRPASARELARRLGEIDEASPWTQERARAWWVAVRDHHRLDHVAG